MVPITSALILCMLQISTAVCVFTVYEKTHIEFLFGVYVRLLPKMFTHGYSSVFPAVLKIHLSIYLYCMRACIHVSVYVYSM